MPPLRRPELALLLQAILIALPVAILAGSTLHLLRDDRTEAERQARDNARAIAPELARLMGQRLSDELLSGAKSAARRGSIIGGAVVLPEESARLPVPADWPRSLTPQQAQWWKIAQDPASRQPDATVARGALTGLLNSKARNPALLGNVQWEFLELKDWAYPSADLAAQAISLAQIFPRAVTPSGTPIAPLALLLALQHTRAGTLDDRLFQAVENNTVSHVSFLTQEVLQAAQQAAGNGALASRVAELQRRWKDEETARDGTRESLHALLGTSMRTDRPSEVWLHQSSPPELALINPVNDGWQVTLFSQTSLTAVLRKALQAADSLPDYAGATVQIGGEPLRVAGNPGPRANPQPLASAGGNIPLPRGHGFGLRLDLANPALLYARSTQRRRLLEFAIVCAAGAALIGLITLWNGHRRQIRLNEAKSNFVSSVSHELRAPIAAVRLMAESLESGRVTAEAKRHDYYRLIAQECRRISALVENVLDVSRIDQGRRTYRFEPVDVMALLRHTVALMQPNAEQRHIRIVLSEPPEPANQPSWDNEAVEQSLVNLLDNAIKHSPEGSEVQVEMEVRGDKVRLWVRDSGPGIPMVDHARIFERFYRRGDELRRETRGVGIGLSIVKHVAEGHGGRVLVESAEGRGSSFGLELPLHAGATSS